MSKQYNMPTEAIHEALSSYQTPFHIYDMRTMQTNTARLYGAMREVGFKDFQNFFAVKALPNPHVLKKLIAIGHGLDCSSLAELELAKQVGLSGEQIMFTSNNTTLAEFEKANQLSATINFDDESLVDRYLDNFAGPAVACCRFNPGSLSTDSEEVQKIIGRPAEAKYGMDYDSILRSYQKLKSAGVKKFGLHTMLLSNNLSWSNHAQVAKLMFELASDISQQIDIELSFINLGGGIGVAYRPEDGEFDYQSFARAVKDQYEASGLSQFGGPRIIMENGRSITATAGWLVTSVQNFKQTHKSYVGVDASMADLMRPGIYGAYHHITLLEDDGDRPESIVDVVGALCENNDKFAIDRSLPKLKLGDHLVVHHTGAHGHAMGFNYNGRLRSKELLVDEGGAIEMIRRAETLDDLFATIMPLDESS